MNRGVFIATKEDIDYLKSIFYQNPKNPNNSLLASKLEASTDRIELSAEETEYILDEIGLDNKQLFVKLRGFLTEING